MAKSSKLFEHTQIFVREVMADRLRQEGFISYKDEDIHWYRLANNEVIHAVYFVTRHTALHTNLEIRYGCHPVFIPPVFQKSPYFYQLPGYEQMNDRVPESIPGSTFHGFHSLQIYGMFNRPYRVPDSLIMCPEDKHNGLDVLELVFPTMDTLITPLACYQMHKMRREREMESVLLMSSYFVDEVLYWEDRPLYAFCQKYVESCPRWYQKMKNISKTNQKEIERCLMLQKIFIENRPEEYLKTFSQKEDETLHLLNKYTSIRTKH